MSLTQGFRVGVYEIEMPIGIGGMGEVYRARDTQLGRPVAVKVLPDTFANDPERRARFEREAKTLAALNHPNIAVIHGFESSNGTHALVMEFVEGPTLADRIAEGPIPLDEALPIARQVAAALEAAHEQGIIHRDLKPANIKVRLDGTVKVLDFGLAKVLPPIGAAHGDQHATVTQTTSPGVVLGTPVYMSPEQARGRTVDKRADIWAFGCVLYEMLTGQRPFIGESTTDTVAAVLNIEPDLHALPTQTAMSVRGLLVRCLTKDSVKRLRDIGEARILLDSVHDQPATAGPAAHAERHFGGLAVVAAMVAIALISGFTSWQLRGARNIPVAATSMLTRRAVVPLRGTVDTTRGSSIVPAISADGAVVVYTAALRGGRGQLHIRRLDALDSFPIQGTEGADMPFLSDDGKRLGFERDGEIWIVPIEGGAATRAADSVSRDSKPAWLADGRIVFTGAAGELRITRPGSNVTEPLTTPRAGERHLSPIGLPDGSGVMFTTVGSVVPPRIEVVSTADRSTRAIIDEVATTPQIVDNVLVYSRLDGTLVAVPFDRARAIVTGIGQPLPDRVSRTRFGIAQDAAARDVLVYVGAARNRLLEADRTGRFEILSLDERTWHHPRYSPDGSRIVSDLSTAGGNDRDVWIFHRDTSMLSRVTRVGDAHDPVWLPDGQHVSFFSFSSAGGPLMIAAADGGSEPQPVPIANGFTPMDLVNPGGWLRDGTAFIGGVRASTGTGDLWRIPRKGTPSVLVASTFDEVSGTVSGDGHWLLYQSNETGRMEIYVRPVSGREGRVQVSNNGATDPVWDPKGNAVYYIETHGDRRDLMAAILRMQPLAVVRRETILRDVQIAQANNHANYDVHPDGSRFVMPVVATTPNLITVFDWAASLRPALEARRRESR